MLRVVAACICLCCVVTGCSSRNSRDRWARLRHKTYPVRVLVTWNGEPTKDAVVVFESTAHPVMAVGRTDGIGECPLKTYEPGDGAVAGEHRVRVEKFVVSGTTGDGRILDVSIMPSRYAEAATSGLTAYVSEIKKNKIRIDVTGPRRSP